jgi:uncharacterized protein YndB with AHSA1/START domain
VTEVDTARSPVRKRIRVACDVEHAFRTFTEGIRSWWPVRTHSISAGPNGEHPPEAVVLESTTGGRLYEVAHDGRECNWATIRVFDFPRRLVLEWNVNPAIPATEVEVLFTRDGEGTIVELEHRGWERLTTDAEATRASYDSGWQSVLGCYTRAVPAMQA